MIRTKLIWTVAVSLCVVAMSMATLAQGRYDNYSRTDVDNFIRSLENSSDIFSREFERAARPTANERRIVERFENAVDNLRRRFDSSGNNWRQNRNEVQRIMNEANQVNVMMNSERFARPLERQWRDLRRDINALANGFGLPGLSGQGAGYGSGYGDGYGGGRRGRNVPSWAIGTFYGRDPNTGSMVTLMIERNGSVTASVDGQIPSYGSIDGTMMTNGPYVSRLTRRNNGFRTTDVNDTGHFIDYFRDQNSLGVWNPRGDGNPRDGWNPGGMGQGNVPTWAVGTFYGSDPATGQQVALSINRDGAVTISVDGAQPTFASMNGTTLSNGPYVSRVTRINNGIRTIDVNDSSRYIDYFRR